MVHINVPVTVVVLCLSLSLSFAYFFFFLHAVFVDKSTLSTLLLVINLSNDINIFSHTRRCIQALLTWVCSAGWEQGHLNSGVYLITTLWPCEHAGLGPFTSKLWCLTLRYCTPSHGCDRTDVHLCLSALTCAWKALCNKLSLVDLHVFKADVYTRKCTI